MKRVQLLVVSAVLLVFFATRLQDGSDIERSDEPAAIEEPAQETKRWVAPSHDDAPATQPASAPICVADASAHCSAGKLFAFDSCAKRGALLDDCGGFGCIDEECVLPPRGPACPQGLSEIGRCVDGALEYCHAGIAARVDCARLGRVCSTGLDGEAGCLPPPPTLCQALGTVGRCDGNTAQLCQGGKLVMKKCTYGSHCSTEGGAHCEWVTRYSSAALATEGCSLCGCSSVGPRGQEVCDGFDNDGNGSVDEGTVCRAVEIRAVVVRDRFGQPSASAEEIAQELQAVNAVFSAAGRDTGLRFVLGETKLVDRPEWLAADDTTLGQAFADPSLFAAPFRIPVLFAQTLETDGKSHPGVATLPDGTCADLQLPHDAENGNGLVVVAHRRYSTTLAHELGHYLGLCHTHQASLARDLIRHDTATTSYRCADCLRSGDGICDTPLDPGTNDCLTNDDCTTSCPAPYAPDSSNIMSYYSACRTRFSSEQTLQLHRYLARRTVWHACRANPSACACNLLLPCPPGMMMHCDLPSSLCVPD